MPKYTQPAGAPPPLSPAFDVPDAVPYNMVTTSPSRGVFTTTTNAWTPDALGKVGYATAYSAEPVPVGRGRS